MKKAKDALTIWKECLCPEMAETVEICKKLSALEKEWQTLFSAENRMLGEKTAAGSCTVEKDGICLTVYAKNKSDITGLKFKQALFCSAVENFLGVRVKKINFEAGKVCRVSTAKEASKAFERYAKVIVTEEQIERQKEFFTPFVEDKELAKIMAETKLIAEKRAKRKLGG